ncbi:lipopolysaccharide-induced tumor necrosis factor-alpha factor homolog [Linepithema humile]|uniref:lipopolysaccharide-induced tumor necrosis factor-alpha factor homolog n=1 Tax=Linepithema humile TaxID=83485 RepID=UPI0006239CED|nr:PREDICTED: lipopolysaccharide-induced tumor necrosis factor-alpha factor homolog [Linepithema humile]XP_012220539.1 PREDICTED: lipopolysaccharide-induced tumor necrosis factor-alpha factor homolog [Linepithema humile]
MSKMDPPSYTSPPYPYPQPPPQEMPQPQPVPQQNLIIMPTVFGSESQHLICPHCRANIMTSVESGPNSKTHMFALLLCVFGLCCFAPCPYCIDSCKVQKHYCPECKNYLGESNN